MAHTKKIGLIIIVLIFLIALLCIIDHREAHFTYIGEVKINPPTSYYRGDTVVWIFRKGEALRQYLDTNLFHGTKTTKQGESLKVERYPETDHYKLEWGDGLHIDPEEKYYIGVGCKIEKMTYFYHTMLYYPRSIAPCFRAHDVQLVPDYNVLTIYKGDVALASL